jgi:hypothetical protein
MGGAFSTNWGEGERIYVIAGKSEGKRPLVRQRRRWVEILRWIF